MAIKTFSKNVLRTLLALFGLNVFTACYGPAPCVPSVAVWGKVVDENEAPVQGIKITEENEKNESLLTSTEKGEFEYSLFCRDEDNIPETLTLIFTDIDGPENGGEFEEKVVFVDLKEQASKPEPMVVKLSLKK